MIWNRNVVALGARERLILWLVVYKTGILVALLKDEDILNVSNLRIELDPVEIEFHFSKIILCGGVYYYLFTHISQNCEALFIIRVVTACSQKSEQLSGWRCCNI